MSELTDGQQNEEIINAADGLLSYTMPQGERRGTELDLSDLTYDGKLENGWLTGGLGQLTDGAEGHSNFRLDTDGHGRKGYEWVGWKNDTIMSLMSSATSGGLSAVGVASSEPVVSILFEFDRPRNFSSVRFHCNNMFSKEVRVFRKAIIHFSLDGVFRDSVARSSGGSGGGGSNHGFYDASSARRPRRHDRSYGYKIPSTHSHHHHHHHNHHHRSLLATTQGDLTYALQYPPVTFEFMRDTLIDFARNVIVAIPGRVARFVRVDLLFDARWLMMSEVRFESGRGLLSEVVVGFLDDRFMVL